MMDVNAERIPPAGGAKSKRAAPYTSFKTLTTFIEDQKSHRLPRRIDRSVLTKFSGGVGSQLITALKFLGLIDNDQNSTEQLYRLVDAYGTDSWQMELRAVIDRAYAHILASELDNVTPQQFHELFKEAYVGSDDVIRKSETFFIGAAKAAGITMSARISKYRAPRGGGTRRRSAATSSKENESNGEAVGATKERGNAGRNPTKPAAHHEAKPLQYQLVDLLKRPDLEDAQRKAVWTLVEFLMVQEQDNRPDTQQFERSA